MDERRVGPREIVVPWMNNMCAKLTIQGLVVMLLVAAAELWYTISGISTTTRIIVLVIGILAAVVSWEVLSQRTVVAREGAVVRVYTEIFSLRIPRYPLDAQKGNVVAKNGSACLGYQSVCISYEVDLMPKKPLVIPICRTTLPHARILKSEITTMATKARQHSNV